jgi:hypothetical protein
VITVLDSGRKLSRKGIGTWGSDSSASHLEHMAENVLEVHPPLAFGKFLSTIFLRTVMGRR